jgi:hypothetical protein
MAATRTCSSTPWTDSVRRIPSFAALCDGADDQSIVLCRAIQKLMRETTSGGASG